MPRKATRRVQDSSPFVSFSHNDNTYQIDFPNAGVRRGDAIFSIMGTRPMVWNIQVWWQTADGWEHFLISCFDPSNGAGNPAALIKVGFIA